jgi:hypothetical protein
LKSLFACDAAAGITFPAPVQGDEHIGKPVANKSASPRREIGTPRG